MFDRTSRVVLGVVGAFALGMIAGAQLDRTSTPSMTQAVEAAPAAAPEPAPATPPARARAVRLERVPAASSPAVQKQVKLLLNAGADTRMAAEGFGNARELITVAYAARNTDIPFMLLKHRVLKERMSLASAIQKSRPELDEIAEVNRARAEARADLARISS
ncbi:MAG: hypothetical protein U0P30_06695 [Vicinamibacterales bacterium]